MAPKQTDLVVTVHQLQPPAGLLLLHMAQRTLQAEHHVLIFLYDLQEESPEILRWPSTANWRHDLGGTTGGEGSQEPL